VGKVRPSNDTYAIDRIGIYYDIPPTDLIYEENKFMNSYNLGDLVAIVVKPAPLFHNYEKPDNYTLIEAKSWNDDNNSIDIRFDLSPVMSRQGVYTVVPYLKDDNLNSFPAGSYSIFS
jgi:hypothetical protein